METQLIFVHGWGLSPDFWDGLIEQLPEFKNTNRIDLGFIGEQQDILETPSEDSIFVTHSLGTMWALKNHHTDMQALMAINGFGCFQKFTNQRVLRAMKQRLHKEPKAQMADFWNMCDLPSSEDINKDKLEEGLEWLASWDLAAQLESLSCPILSLAGERDSILSIDLMKEEWKEAQFHVSEDDGHALPVSNPQWCADHMKEFLRGL